MEGGGTSSPAGQTLALSRAKPSHLLATQLSSHGRSASCKLCRPPPTHSMEAGDVISGALRVLKEKCRKFVYVDWSDVGVVSGGG